MAITASLPLLNILPASSGVSTALGNRGCGTSVDSRRWDSGGGISLRDGDLLSLAGLLSTVRTKALPFQHRGTSSMEAMGNADIWLALHEGSLSEKKQKERFSKPLSQTFHCLRNSSPCGHSLKI